MKGIYDTTLKVFQKDYLTRGNQFHFSIKNKDNCIIGYEIYDRDSMSFHLHEDYFKVPKHGIWHAPFHPDRNKTQKVFIFNRVIDALSYYQIYRPKIDFSTSAFVSLGNGVGRRSFETLQELYPGGVKVKYYCAFGDGFNGLIYNLALEKCINPKFNFQLGRVGECFECVINGESHELNWIGLNFESLFSVLALKPQLRLLLPKIGLTFYEMLLALQTNCNVGGRLMSDRTKV
jgi:hypothetical protein